MTKTTGSLDPQLPHHMGSSFLFLPPPPSPLPPPLLPLPPQGPPARGKQESNGHASTTTSRRGVHNKPASTTTGRRGCITSQPASQGQLAGQHPRPMRTDRACQADVCIPVRHICVHGKGNNAGAGEWGRGRGGSGSARGMGVRVPVGGHPCFCYQH